MSQSPNRQYGEYLDILKFISIRIGSRKYLKKRVKCEKKTLCHNSTVEETMLYKLDMIKMCKSKTVKFLSKQCVVVVVFGLIERMANTYVMWCFWIEMPILCSVYIYPFIESEVSICQFWFWLTLNHTDNGSGNATHWMPKVKIDSKFCVKARHYSSFIMKT